MIIFSQAKQYDLSTVNGRKQLLAKISLLKKAKQKQALEFISSQINKLTFKAAVGQNFHQEVALLIPDLIKVTDIALYPRSEFCARFAGTTAFVMNNPEYWGHYHRGESTRFFDEADGRKNTQFFNEDFLVKPPRINSFFAHTGGIHNPFSSPVKKYQASIKQTTVAPTEKNNVRDAILVYKGKIAEQVVASFEEVASNEIKLLKPGCSKSSMVRPIVIYENDYPCVLVSSPLLSPVESPDEITKFWSNHPKPMQRLLQACFVAYVNVAAKKAGIPIETVIRSSFGHNLPSVCETNDTFRINVGIIPKQYAVILGESLQTLNQAFIELKDVSATRGETTIFDAEFFANVRKYNARKLKKAIDSKPRYKKLKELAEYRKAENSNESLATLYEEFKKLDEGQPAKGRANITLVELPNISAWELIRKPGDTKGRPLLAELFRHNKVVDWFANAVMTELLKEEPNPIETALIKLLGYLSYGEKVTLTYNKIDDDLKKTKFSFSSLSFANIYKEDTDFSSITNALFSAFCAKRPDESMYAGLDVVGSKFMANYRGSNEIQEDFDNGSTSEFSEDIPQTLPKTRLIKPVVKHFSHSKLRVCSGMKAIVLAHYGALSYLNDNKIKTYKLDVLQMYYEVSDAINLVKKIGPRPTVAGDTTVMYIDLNHCNAANTNSNKTLAEKLELVTTSTVMVLDYTSSTHEAAALAMQKCLFNVNVKLILMVSSDLKNSQGGLDLNPYGEIRVIARERSVREKIIGAMAAVLVNSDKLSPQTHEMVRACKNRGLAFSLQGFFKSKAEATTHTANAHLPKNLR